MLRRVQVRPFHIVEGKFRSDHFERARTDVYVERAVEVAAEVQSARREDRPLPVQGAVRVILRRAGCDAVPLDDDAAHECPLTGHGQVIVYFTSLWASLGLVTISLIQ